MRPIRNSLWCQLFALLCLSFDATVGLNCYQCASKNLQGLLKIPTGGQYTDKCSSSPASNGIPSLACSGLGLTNPCIFGYGSVTCPDGTKLQVALRECLQSLLKPGGKSYERILENGQVSATPLCQSYNITIQGITGMIKACACFSNNCNNDVPPSAPADSAEHNPAIIVDENQTTDDELFLNLFEGIKLPCGINITLPTTHSTPSRPTTSPSAAAAVQSTTSTAASIKPSTSIQSQQVVYLFASILWATTTIIPRFSSAQFLY